MSGSVTVLGAGVGSLTAASLLSRSGWSVELREVPRSPPPAVVLNELTQALLGDLFGPDVLAGGYPLDERRVRWGHGAEEACVPTHSVALDGAVLLGRLRAQVAGDTSPINRADWLIHGTGRGGAGGWPRRTFGRRAVLQAEVRLARTDCRSSWIETVADGWVHLAPIGLDMGVVQAMVPRAPADAAQTLERMTAAAVGISREVGEWRGGVSVFAAAPSVAVPACGPGRISVAEAAISIDPLSGSGTAWAVRGGILAAAVLDAIASGLPEDECLGHYSDRLDVAVGEHVDHCLRVYSSAFSTPEWDRELDLMAEGRREHQRSRSPAALTYRLNRFRLERVRIV